MTCLQHVHTMRKHSDQVLMAWNDMLLVISCLVSQLLRETLQDLLRNRGNLGSRADCITLPQAGLLVTRQPPSMITKNNVTCYMGHRAQNPGTLCLSGCRQLCSQALGAGLSRRHVYLAGGTEETRKAGRQSVVAPGQVACSASQFG